MQYIQPAQLMIALQIRDITWHGFISFFRRKWLHAGLNVLLTIFLFLFKKKLIETLIVVFLLNFKMGIIPILFFFSPFRKRVHNFKPILDQELSNLDESICGKNCQEKDCREKSDHSGNQPPERNFFRLEGNSNSNPSKKPKNTKDNPSKDFND